MFASFPLQPSRDANTCGTPHCSLRLVWGWYESVAGCDGACNDAALIEAMAAMPEPTPEPGVSVATALVLCCAQRNLPAVRQWLVAGGGGGGEGDVLTQRLAEASTKQLRTADVQAKWLLDTTDLLLQLCNNTSGGGAAMEGGARAGLSILALCSAAWAGELPTAPLHTALPALLSLPAWASAYTPAVYPRRVRVC